jgi:hypothetical protein
MPAHRKKKGRLIIRLTETSSTQTTEAAEDEGRPTQTADNFASQPVHSAQENAVLATEVASVQRHEDPVPGTEEVRSTDGKESRHRSAHRQKARCKQRKRPVIPRIPSGIQHP